MLVGNRVGEGRIQITIIFCSLLYSQLREQVINARGPGNTLGFLPVYSDLDKFKWEFAKRTKLSSELWTGERSKNDSSMFKDPGNPLNATRRLCVIERCPL